MMHQVLCIVQLANEEGDMHIMVHHDMPCDHNLVSSTFYTIPILFPFYIANFFDLLVNLQF